MVLDTGPSQEAGFLRGLFSRRRAGPPLAPPLPGPIRGELLGAEKLAERARQLAETERLVGARRKRYRAPLLARLRETSRILDDAQQRLSAAASAHLDVGPAGEWLLDNYHVVQEHVREVRQSLPRSYYRELPELAEGPLVGHPRVYEIAVTIIGHTEGRINLESVELFGSAFQERASLSLGELWAMPAMLRLGLIENVRRMTLRTIDWLAEVEAAEQWAKRIDSAHEQGRAAIAGVLNDFVHHHPPLTAVFVARFLQQLRLVASDLTPLAWLEPWLAEEGMSAEEAAARSTERLALTQLVMATA